MLVLAPVLEQLSELLSQLEPPVVVAWALTAPAKGVILAEWRARAAAVVLADLAKVAKEAVDCLALLVATGQVQAATIAVGKGATGRTVMAVGFEEGDWPRLGEVR